MLDNKKELALYVINFKIAKTIKENEEKNFDKFQEKIKNLKLEKAQVYENNAEIIEKIISEYLPEIKK